MKNEGNKPMTDITSFGHFEGKVYILPVRIYYEDTDLSSVVYHANYLRFMERGRTEFMRVLGAFELRTIDGSEPVFWALRRIGIEYFLPARLNDLIEIHTKIVSVTGARIVFEQTIFREGVQLTCGSVEVCTISLKGRPQRISQEIRNKLLSYS